MHNEIIYDLIKEFYKGSPPPTFRRAGIQEDMDGEGTTRIDTILANPAASSALSSCEYLHSTATQFDHVPLMCSFLTHLFRQMIKAPIKPQPISFPDTKGWTQQQRARYEQKGNDYFTDLWTFHEEEFKQAITNRDLQKAHEIWCRAAEEFLIGMQGSITDAKSH